jgi:hypothetical protein
MLRQVALNLRQGTQDVPALIDPQLRVLLALLHKLLLVSDTSDQHRQAYTEEFRVCLDLGRVELQLSHDHIEMLLVVTQGQALAKHRE